MKQPSPAKLAADNRRAMKADFRRWLHGHAPMELTLESAWAGYCAWASGKNSDAVLIGFERFRELLTCPKGHIYLRVRDGTLRCLECRRADYLPRRMLRTAACVPWLEYRLKMPRKWSDLYRAAREAGFTRPDLAIAKRVLGVRTRYKVVKTAWLSLPHSRRNDEADHSAHRKTHAASAA